MQCRAAMKEQPPGMQETPFRAGREHSSLVMTRAQDANTHGSVYGGWLLRAALEAGQAAAQLESGQPAPEAGPRIEGLERGEYPERSGRGVKSRGLKDLDVGDTLNFQADPSLLRLTPMHAASASIAESS